MAKNELVSLSLVYLNPKHVYAINQIIHKMALEKWTTISRASIYNCFQRLEKKGFVCAKLEKIGNMPERKLYEITELGKEALAKEIRHAILVDEPSLELFNLSLQFGLGVSTEELIDLLMQKKEHLSMLIPEKKKVVEELRGFGIKHAVITMEASFKKQEAVIEVIDKLSDLLKKEPDYYLKNLERIEEYSLEKNN